MNYAVHPGNGKLTPSSPVSYIDAGTLASLYGLLPTEYIVSNDYDPMYIHLVPRNDGRYQSIKRELGDNGQRYYQDYPAFMHTTHDGKFKSMRKIQPQYKDTFRDKRGRDDEKIL